MISWNPRTPGTPRRIAGSLPLAGNAIVAIVAIVALGTATFGGPTQALAFPEETETQGEIATDLNGVWLVVHHLKFNRPTPQATPATGALPTTRAFNVLNLFKITHLKQDEAQKVRDARAAKLQVSVAKAEALIAKDTSAQIPVQTEEGEIEGGARVIVPQIPRPPGYDPKIHSGDKVEIFLLDVNLPKTVDDAFQAAQKTETNYEPTDKELALLGSSWDKLTFKKDTEYSRIEWKVIAPEFYDQGLQYDPMLRDTLFTISGSQGMVPRPSQPSRNIVVYGIREAKDGVLRGTHSRAMMATAPFPIPIEMGGTVRMIKIADLPKPAAIETADPTEDTEETEETEAKKEKTGQPAS